MKLTRQRLMELAGLRETVDDIDPLSATFVELMDFAKGVKGFKKLSDTKFQFRTKMMDDRFENLEDVIMQVEPGSLYKPDQKPLPRTYNRMLVKIGNKPAKEMDSQVVYHNIYTAMEGDTEDFNNSQLGSKSTKAANKVAKGIKVQDDEGEAITTLTDVSSAADLMRRIKKEPEEYQQVWAEIPYAFDVVGPDSMYNTTEEDVEDLEHYPPTTYEKWIKGYRDWAKDVLAGE